jgi:hypothetical protein
MPDQKAFVSPYLLRPLRTIEQVLRRRSRSGGSVSEAADREVITDGSSDAEARPESHV